MIKFQIYSHFKLPITKEPLKFGKLLDQSDNKFIIQLSTKNIAVINHYEKENFVRIFKNGDLVLEFNDKLIKENSFIRTINDTRFLFENDKLISTQIKNALRVITIYPFNEDTNALLTKNSTITQLKLNIDSIFDWIDKSKDPVKAFLIWKACLALILFIIFVILPDYFLNVDNSTLVSLSAGNIVKLRKTPSKYNWNKLVLNVNNKVFTKDLFERIFNKFWSSIETKFTDNNHMFILFKIKYTNKEILTIGKIQRLNKYDKKWYIDFILENIKFKSEYYKETQIESFIISYGLKSGMISNQNIDYTNINFQNYKNNNLPISINPLDYGRIIIQNKTESGVNYIIHNEKGLTIKFNQFENYNEIEFFKLSISLIKFTDILINKSNFLRKIDNKQFYFENGKQVLFTSEIKTKFISKLVKSKILTNNFISLDIETFVQDNTLIPYLICFYDGKNVYSFGLWDYDSVEMMILDCLKSILIRKYNGYNIYIHNMAKFDIIFLLKHIVKIANVQPVIHNSRIISLTINYGKNNEYRIEFKDSYLLLLNSLAKLTKGFRVDTQKSIFPFLFVNEDNLNYIGKVPDFKYFGNKIKLSDYKEYNNFSNNWSLKNEAIKYCEIDCISLYQVMFKFSDLIFSLFNKNVHHYPTLPSLAFGIFRSNFMVEENIPQLSGKIAKDIRQGYTGGAVDVYIPKPAKAVNIKCYDVNSLYPSQMLDKLMPIGLPTYFEGNIRAFNPNAFGFFFCEIVAPDDIKHPIIQTHVKINNMIRTIAPIGQWSDMLFSMEMDNAMKLGYKFNILWGYTFDSSKVFKEYVDFLYNLRTQYPKSDPMNFIAKILLNSLYGRFGMDDNFANINVIHKDYFANFENKFFDQIEEIIDLDDHILVFHKKCEQSNEEVNSTHNVSISIAAAITAYSRIHMSQFKNNPKINLYYTDTDSIYTDSDIDDSFINDTILGKLKLENTCKKAIFLAPKLYCLLSESNEFIHKVKGLKHEVDLNFEDFENLLFKDFSIEKTHTKWKRSLTEGKINLLNELYTLQVTDNKRKLIYKNNKLIGTKAYKINKDKIIIK